MHESGWGVLSEILTSFVNFQIDLFELQRLSLLIFIGHFCKKTFHMCFLKCSWIPTLFFDKMLNILWNVLCSCISTILALFFILIFMNSFMRGFGSHQSSQMLWLLNVVEKPKKHHGGSGSTWGIFKTCRWPAFLDN